MSEGLSGMPVPAMIAMGVLIGWPLLGIALIHLQRWRRRRRGW